MVIPEVDIDLWSDEVLANPYPAYAHLRAQGSVLHDARHDAYVVAGYDEVRQALQDWETFSSAHGVGLNERANSMSGRGILTTDPPLHDSRRRVLNSQLVPREVAQHRPFLVDTANEIVDGLVVLGGFDAVADLAHRYSVQVVADLCGLPVDGRDLLIERASAAFDTFGPANERCERAWDGFFGLYDYATNVATRDRLAPGSWGSQIYDAGEQGVVEPEACPGLMLAYVWAGMDTTVNAIASAVSLFADHPDEWALLRSDTSLLASATNEVLRIEPPVQRFTRLTTCETVLGGVTLPAGSRVAVLFGSANRDERRFPEPDRFDIRRNPTDHLSFGRGVHRCVGANLAQEEIKAVLERLAERVERFHVVDRRWRRNNALHGLERLDVRIDPATIR